MGPLTIRGLRISKVPSCFIRKKGAGLLALQLGDGVAAEVCHPDVRFIETHYLRICSDRESADDRAVARAQLGNGPASRAGPPLISPDGSLLAFGGIEDQGLWLRPLRSLATRPLPGTGHAWYTFWSPDSRWLGFLAGQK